MAAICLAGGDWMHVCTCDGKSQPRRPRRARPPLFAAAMSGHATCVRLLLDAGADANAVGYVRFVG